MQTSSCCYSFATRAWRQPRIRKNGGHGERKVVGNDMSLMQREEEQKARAIRDGWMERL